MTPGTGCDIQWSVHIPTCQCMTVSETMKLPHSAGKAIVVEQTNRWLLWDNGLTVSNGRAVPPATERDMNPLGFTLVNSRSVLRATP
jgi:hypothetical protein